jgi:hypothetical protein
VGEGGSGGISDDIILVIIF